MHAHRAGFVALQKICCGVLFYYYRWYQISNLNPGIPVWQEVLLILEFAAAAELTHVLTRYSEYSVKNGQFVHIYHLEEIHLPVANRQNMRASFRYVC